MFQEFFRFKKAFLFMKCISKSIIKIIMSYGLHQFLYKTNHICKTPMCSSLQLLVLEILINFTFRLSKGTILCCQIIHRKKTGNRKKIHEIVFHIT